MMSAPAALNACLALQSLLMAVAEFASRWSSTEAAETAVVASVLMWVLTPGFRPWGVLWATSPPQCTVIERMHHAVVVRRFGRVGQGL